MENISAAPFSLAHWMALPPWDRSQLLQSERAEDLLRCTTESGQIPNYANIYAANLSTPPEMKVNLIQFAGTLRAQASHVAQWINHANWRVSMLAGLIAGMAPLHSISHCIGHRLTQASSSMATPLLTLALVMLTPNGELLIDWLKTQQLEKVPNDSKQSVLAATWLCPQLDQDSKEWLTIKMPSLNSLNQDIVAGLQSRMQYWLGAA